MAMTTKRSPEIPTFIRGQAEGEEVKMQTEKEWLERKEEIQESVVYHCTQGVKTS